MNDNRSSPAAGRRLPQSSRRILAIAGLLALSSATAFAATYHVSSSGGHDDNPGTEERPWRTLARVNAAGFAPGDEILLKRGDTWNGESLKISSSGHDGARIVFGSYATGSKPVIDPGESRQMDCVLISGRRHLIIQDLDLRRGFGGVRCNEDSAHVALLRLDVSDSGGTGITLRQSSHMLVDGCTVRRAGNCGILMHGSEGEPKVNNCIVQNCTASDLRSNDGIVIHQDSRGNGAGANFLIRHNVSFNNPEQGYDITAGSHVVLEDNVSHDNRGGSFDISHVANHVTVRRHHSFNEPTAGSNNLRISAPFVTVEHSRFIGPSEPNPAKTVSVVSIGPGSESQPEDVRLFNNVFVWNSPRPGLVFRLTNGGVPGKPQVTIERLAMQNNIFVTRSATTGGILIRDLATPLTSAGLGFSHNLYYGTEPAAGVRWSVENREYDFAAYRVAFGKDASSFEADPRFVDPAVGDYHLQTGSPAIDAGATLGLTRDAAGVTVPQGGAPDLGAYEFIPLPGTPVTPQAQR